MTGLMIHPYFKASIRQTQTFACHLIYPTTKPREKSPMELGKLVRLGDLLLVSFYLNLQGVPRLTLSLATGKHTNSFQRKKLAAFFCPLETSQIRVGLSFTPGSHSQECPVILPLLMSFSQGVETTVSSLFGAACCCAAVRLTCTSPVGEKSQT